MEFTEKPMCRGITLKRGEGLGQFADLRGGEHGKKEGEGVLEGEG